jgi:hypothetical protein
MYLDNRFVPAYTICGSTAALFPELPTLKRTEERASGMKALGSCEEIGDLPVQYRLIEPADPFLFSRKGGS